MTTVVVKAGTSSRPAVAPEAPHQALTIVIDSDDRRLQRCTRLFRIRLRTCANLKMPCRIGKPEPGILFTRWDPLQDGTKREPLQITGDAERSLPHARRKTRAATGTESATQVIGEHHCRETPRNALVPPSMAITPTLGFHYMDHTIYEFPRQSCAW